MHNSRSLERDLLTVLSDTLVQVPAEKYSSALARYDASLLSSAWQKAIRRGDTNLAIRCALELHHRDPDYIWRRIRIIALEDISVGDTELAASILAIAGKRVLQKAWGEGRLISSLMTQLANAHKSRTACDLVVALPSDPTSVDARVLTMNLAHFDHDQLLLLASTWRQTTAYSTQQGGRWRTLSKGNSGLRDQYLDRIKAPDLVRFIATRGSGTEALNTLLVPASQLKALACDTLTPTSPPTASWDLIQGLPAYAYCMYSAPGMQALGQFLRHSDWTPRLQALGVRNLRKALGYLVFYVEGGYLHRPLHVCHAAAIQEWSEELALGRFGIPADQVKTLKADMAADLPRLNAFRRLVAVERLS